MIAALIVAALFHSLLVSHVNGRAFKDLSYEDIEHQSKDLRSPFAHVKSAHELYGLPAAKAKDGFECSPSIIRVSRLSDLQQDKRRPQILISGEIHGDERVGPPSTLHTSQLLIWSALCEVEGDTSYCNKLQDWFQVSPAQRRWLAFLATSRDSILIPAANCLGHKFRRRDDNFIDPNRDFPYSRKNNACLLSTTAKIFDRIMKDNIIQVVVTFHAGMAALGYEWGSKNHPSPNDASPDDNANKRLAALYSQYGSHAGDGRASYRVNRINSIVYAVDGGMEDWMYAAGWDKSLLHQDCLGKKATGGPSYSRFLQSVVNATSFLRTRQLTGEATRQQDSSAAMPLDGNRALVFLVETSDAKTPAESSLGGGQEVLLPDGKENGHVPRNVRLSLMAIDLLEPYVCFSQATMNSSPPVFDANRTHHTNVPSVSSFLHLKWYVGGAHQVDKTFLTLSRAPVTTSIVGKAWSQLLDILPTDMALDELLAQRVSNHSHASVGSSKHRNAARLISPVMTGPSRWHDARSSSQSGKDAIESNQLDPLHPKHEFVLTLNLSRVFSHRKRKLSDPLSGLGSLDSSASSSSAASFMWPGSSRDEEPLPSEEKSNGHSDSRESVKVKGKGAAASTMASAVSGVHDRLRSRRLRQYNDVDKQFISERVLSTSLSSSSATPSVRGKYWVVAWAVVDQDFGHVGQGFPSESGPMSYYSNIRTHSETKCVPTGPEQRTCRGRRYWPSELIELDVSDDGTVTHMSPVLHCATWTRPIDGNGQGHHTTAHGEDLVTNTDTTEHAPQPAIPSLQPDIESSYLFERSYMMTMIAFAIVGLLLWHGASCWRRHRIYASVMGNKYLQLPTGFRSSPPSPGTLSNSSSASSFSSAASSAPSSPKPPSSAISPALSTATLQAPYA